MQYRNKLMENATNHFLASASEHGWWSGYSCVFHDLASTRRVGTAKFDCVVVSCISNRYEWEVMTFPCHRVDHDTIVDYAHPLTLHGGKGSICLFDHVDEFVGEVIAGSIDCSDSNREIAYLLAYLNR